MYNDLIDDGIDNVKIIAIGKSQYESSNGNWVNNNDIPVVLDSSPYQTWGDWGASQRDLFFLDINGDYATDFNITTWNYDNIYDTILGLLPEGLSCDEIETTYESLHVGEYATCNYDNDCIAVWGDCDVGLGGCHYTVNEDDYPENEINDLVDLWLENDCMEWVCDCSSPPYADCVDGTCMAAYCMSANPVGCFEAGCPDGYECIDDPNYCLPSWCACDGFYGEWFCTEDCGGGTCHLIQLLGDINNDSEINVLDIVLLIGFILGEDFPNETEFISADFNADGLLNVLDVVSMVSSILGN